MPPARRLATAVVAATVLLSSARGLAAPVEPEPTPTEVDDPPPAPTFRVVDPLKVRGKLSKTSRAALMDRASAAATAATAPGGPYRLRVAVDASGKRRYAVTVTVLGPDDATIAEHRDQCRDCTLDDAGGLIEALVGKAAAERQPPPPAAVSVTIRSTPLGAALTVDGEDRGLTPQTLELPEGPHAIELSKPGFVAHRGSIDVAAEGAAPIEIALEAAAPEPAATPTAPTDPAPTGPKAGRAWTISGAVVLGLGIAGVAAGVAMILVDEDPMALKCGEAQLDFRGVCRYRYDTLLGGIIGTAAGGLGIAGGIALMIKGRQVTVRARTSPQQASVGVGVRF